VNAAAGFSNTTAVPVASASKWVAADGSYAAIIMTKQTSTGPGTGITPSENLNVRLDPLIRQALASGTVTVVRTIP
jgi:hypothetical protein